MEILHDLLIAIAPTVAGACVGYLISSVQHKTNRDKNIESTLLVLVKAMIMDDYERYIESDDPPELSVARKELLVQLGENYKQLGGNGTGSDMIEALKQKPVAIIAHKSKEK